MKRGRAFLVAQVHAAAARGHVIELEQRLPPAGFPDGHHKWWAVCSCGYRSNAARSEAAGLGMVFWHAGKVAGDRDASVNGVSVTPPEPPTP